MYCYNVLREPLLGLLLERLKSCLELEGAWQELEACLHGFQAVAESVHVSESNHLPAFFALLQTVPFNKLNIQVAITTLDVVGKISSQTFRLKNQTLFFVTIHSLRSTAGFKLNWTKGALEGEGGRRRMDSSCQTVPPIFTTEILMWACETELLVKVLITYNLIISIKTNPSIKTIFICLCSSLLFTSNLLAEVFNIGHVVNVLFVARGVCGMDE